MQQQLIENLKQQVARYKPCCTLCRAQIDQCRALLAELGCAGAHAAEDSASAFTAEGF